MQYLLEEKKQLNIYQSTCGWVKQYCNYNVKIKKLGKQEKEYFAKKKEKILLIRYT